MAENQDDSQDRELEPTERRIQRAREQGQLPQSRDITTFALLLGFIIFLLTAGPLLIRQLVIMMQSGLQFSKPITLIDHISEWTSGAFLAVLLIFGVVLLIIWLISIFAPLFLVNFKAYFALQFNLERLDIFAGFARMFSVTVLLEMAKNIFKTILILGISFAYLYGLFSFLRSIVDLDFNLALENTTTFILNGFVLLMMPLLAIAIGDAFLQLFNFRKQIKMSPEEMKQELKESEGSPELKARMRQRQRQIASSRMMSAIERADVVLANPEHYAVAIRYDPDRMSAPIILAKGSDALALRIREVATEHNVPIAQIPPLARYLFNQLDIGESIPAPLFEAIAMVLAWAYEVKDVGFNKDLPDIQFTPELLKPGRALL
ncbi:EscU/YscU/HrcU family type III secretion system export apparatus switch protein [bacterium]|nr:EscU/YscU/HrcU family type III secretion system export apparatus switch protein [bacterium]